MIWLTWRQHRQQALAGAIALAAVGTWLAITHLGIARLYRSTGLSTCLAIRAGIAGTSPTRSAITIRGSSF
jgi:hypothetical protein